VLRRVVFVLACVLALAVFLGGCTDEDAPGASATVAPVPGGRELHDVEGWVNSEPLTVAGELARGRVVLIDFWTYTCVNCLRTLPFIEAWYERYADAGLTVIGVHTPEFEFEERAPNVVAAVERLGLRYPVVQDNDYGTWDAFDNRFWPAKYLLVPGRGVIYQHFGEGDYEATELAIRAALERLGRDLTNLPTVDVTAPSVEASEAARQTSELYGGYRQNFSSRGGFAGQEQYYLEPDVSLTYVDDGKREDNKWYLQGEWFSDRESIAHNRRTTNFEDYIGLRFRARSVNVVLRPEGREPFPVLVELDGRSLLTSEAGADVTFDADGRSVIEVREPRLYNVVQLDSFQERDLKLRANSSDFAVFAFTFGSYVEGP
jgi:thiol-disulfide isomerase/thioredoxin